MTLQKSLSCDLYTDVSPRHPLTAAPAEYWRRIELDYTGGGKSILVYEREPADPEEIPALMEWLNGRAATVGYTVTVVDGVKVP